MIPAFDPATGALPPGDHRATLEEIGRRFGFTPRRRWLLKGLRAAVSAFWTSGIEDIFIDRKLLHRETQIQRASGWILESSQTTACTIGSTPYWIDFEMTLVPQCSEMEMADVGRLRRGVFHPSGYAGQTDSRFSRVLSAGSRRSAQGGVNSGSQVEIIMIKSDAQRERTEGSDKKVFGLSTYQSGVGDDRASAVWRFAEATKE